MQRSPLFQPFKQKIKEQFDSFVEELRTFYVLFRKESVFKYFFLILLLMMIAGVAFLYLEAPRVLAANPDIKDLSFYDKMVTVMYWAIVTIGTVGYGDISPGTTGGRIMSIVLIYLSIGTVSLFSANLSSALTTKKIMERLKGRSTAMLQKQKGLFIICGWKNDMSGLLQKILDVNSNLRPEHVVIIADVSEEEISKFKISASLDRINIIQGEHHNETVLRSVNVHDAQKIMVVADGRGGESEADSKTVMAVITIKAIAPKAFVCAEILNPNYETYLKMAMCDEIIFIKEYSRTLLANAASSIGVAHIIQDLLDPSYDASLITTPIPSQFIGRPYKEYREHVFTQSNDILIGVLENTGTLVEMKRHAIREAQKVADMTLLVASLSALKKLEGNRPHLNPSPDFLIPSNAIGILIRSSAST